MASDKQTQERMSKLYRAILSLKSEDEVAAFMRDLCTPKELEAYGERWAIARRLDGTDNRSYRDIASELGASTTTVTRVARFLRDEPHQGYRLILDRQHHN